ncbi:DUF397 domain-containing protein [Actinomadura sp. WAC 06369]|uniref:DUF397 domain-containing protein n=1 Tax=Actinomadura sp. WAC 06369 TaxID=2203193 RepID=UPI000F77A8A9|nr:DUF397 domain-containing protein [Actinomadura sp. WAC 06369]RSN67267.1 DUF397 domain-containing protein [Actinomadura sp. WAC 06369]
MVVQWRKSSHSGGVDDKACVELGRLDNGAGVGVRDSKRTSGGSIRLTPAESGALVAGLKARPVR